MKYIGIEIGGSLIKGTLIDENACVKGRLNSSTKLWAYAFLFGDHL